MCDKYVTNRQVTRLVPMGSLKRMMRSGGAYMAVESVFMLCSNYVVHNRIAMRYMGSLPCTLSRWVYYPHIIIRGIANCYTISLPIHTHLTVIRFNSHICPVNYDKFIVCSHYLVAFLRCSLEERTGNDSHPCEGRTPPYVICIWISTHRGKMSC